MDGPGPVQAGPVRPAIYPDAPRGETFMAQRYHYVRYGQLELAHFATGIHLTVTQADGRTATYWLSPGEATDLGARLIKMAQDAERLREQCHGS
jgi:hypothetical protein